MTRKLTRKELLKGGIAGAAAVAAVPFGNSVVFASEEGGHVFVHIHALVQNPSVGAFHINVDVAGRSQPDGSLPALSGTGWDTADPDGADQSSFCLFSQRGQLDGRTVKVHGRVFIFNDPANKGASVTTTANLKTGEITWTFDVFVFSGKGVVVKSGD
jgi:hypothetical protein